MFVDQIALFVVIGVLVWSGSSLHLGKSLEQVMDVIWSSVDEVIEVSDVNFNIFTNIINQLMMSLLLLAVFNEKQNSRKSLVCVLDLELELSDLNNDLRSLVVVHVVSGGVNLKLLLQVLAEVLSLFIKVEEL